MSARSVKINLLNILRKLIFILREQVVTKACELFIPL